MLSSNFLRVGTEQKLQTPGGGEGEMMTFPPIVLFFFCSKCEFQLQERI